MKKILKIVVLLATALLVFASCDKEGEVRLLEKTWKITIEERPGPEYYSSTIMLIEEPETRIVDYYLTFSKGGLTVAVSAEEEAENYDLPEYKNHLLIIGAGAYTVEATSSTSGKLTMTGLPYFMSYAGSSFFMYKDLKKNGFTLFISTLFEGEITYDLTVVNDPKFITYAELEAISGVHRK